jgi:hypothetical protein
MMSGRLDRGGRRSAQGGGVRRTFLVLAMLVPLGGCGWFGSKSDKPPEPAGPAVSSDEILHKDCTDENWKKQNLGLWYSVCRQSMRW